MASVERSTVVNVPVNVAYDQWTQFESFPQFMEGVQEVRQLDDKHLHWHAEIDGRDEEWDAEIVDQIPNQRISWRSTSGSPNDGTVTFEPVDQNSTRVTLHLDYEPQGFIESVGSALGFVSRRVDGDLDRFKQFIESRGEPTGAWRGEIQDGSEVNRGGEVSNVGYVAGETAASATGYSGTTGATDYSATGTTGTTGTTGYSTTSSGTAGATNLEQGGEIRVPVVEENVQVGKREVEGGGVRVTTQVEEKPVNEQLNLREEHVTVERRPVDRPLDVGDVNAIREGTVEVTEHREVPEVEKEARVVNEVVVGKEVNTRTENVQAVERRTDVNVEQIPGETRTSTTGTTSATTRGTSDAAYRSGTGDEGAIERGVSKAENAAERATGADLNRDGDVGQRDPRNNVDGV